MHALYGDANKTCKQNVNQTTELAVNSACVEVCSILASSM